MTSDPSRDRRELLRLRDELSSLLESFLERLPLWRGTLYPLSRLCGHAGCRCTRGHLHTSLVLSDSTDDPPRTIVPLLVHVRPLRKMTANYQRFRKARARLVSLLPEMLALVDRLQEEGLRLAQERLPRSKLLRSGSTSRRRPKQGGPTPAK